MSNLDEEYSPHDAINFIYKNKDAYAKAKGQLAQLEAFKSSLKSIKMQQSTQTSMAGKEMDAYASEEYQSLCNGIGAATEQVESLKWALESAKMRFQAFQTMSANNRQIEKFTL
jgi:predicted RNase H-like nuclease (RuvC/YqgF family)